MHTHSEKKKNPDTVSDVRKLLLRLLLLLDFEETFFFRFLDRHVEAEEGDAYQEIMLCCLPANLIRYRCVVL